MTTELKPCPFCGRVPTLKEHGGIIGIVCGEGSECDASGLGMAFLPQKRETAIACWNRRASQAAPGDSDPRNIVADTGHPEADRLIGRLTSADPDFDDCTDAAVLIRKLVAEHKGPDGYATWKDAAIAERMRRVAAPGEAVAWYDPNDFTRTTDRPTEKEYAPLYPRPTDAAAVEMRNGDYRGSVEWSAEDGVYHGKLLGTADLVTYEGDTLTELESAFNEACGDYHRLCNPAPERKEGE